MKFFWYYASRSIINQLKKLFKSWVLIFIVVCMVIGIGVGFGIAKLEDMKDPEPSTPVEEPEEPVQEVDPAVAIQVIEVIEAGIIIGLFSLFAGSAEKNGGSMFLPADATLLFTSPVKPQSVLMFRTISLIGTVFIGVLYGSANIPNMVKGLNFPSNSTFGFIFVLIITVIYSVLIKTWLYLLGSSNNKVRKLITPAIFVIIGCIAASFVIYLNASGQAIGEAILSFFNASFTRYIPIYGWIKYVPVLIVNGEIGKAWIYIGLCLAGVVGFLFLIYATKADYYEEAMAKAEETAQLTRDLQENSSIINVKGKARKDKYRDGSFNKGFGASVYFEKAMYTRKKFATFGFLTKTSFTYLGVALITSFILKFAVNSQDFMPVALALGLFCFYRSLGNPLERDTQSQYFVLIPETISKKMFYSLLGSTTDCLLDLIPACVLATVFIGANPIEAIAWILFIASIDLYATTTGLFINLSVPQNAGRIIKQLVQIMFIYFGLLPDVALIVIGIVLKQLPVYAIGATLMNLVLSVIFIAASQNFILPKDRRAETQRPLEKEELSLAKKNFSTLFFMPIVIAIVASIIQIGIAYVIKLYAPGLTETQGYIWLLSFLPMYLIGLPISMLLLKKVPNDMPRIEKQDISIGSFLKLFTIGIFLMYGGNLVGSLLTMLGSLITGTSPEVGVDTLLNATPTIWTFVFVVVLGPIIEELIFRKFFIDRTRKYGSSLAIVSSAIAFGLFHGNIAQTVYASALGLLLGYIYEKTGKLRYSIALHMCINFFGGVVAPYIVSLVDVNAIASAAESGDYSLLFTQGNIIFVVYLCVLLVLFILGFIFFLFGLRKITYKNRELEVQRKKRFSVGFMNMGMIALFIYFVFSTLVGYGVFSIN